jgi:hypothetical protein
MHRESGMLFRAPRPQKRRIPMQHHDMSHAYHRSQPDSRPQTHVQIAVNNPDMTEQVAARTGRGHGSDGGTVERRLTTCGLTAIPSQKPLCSLQKKRRQHTTAMGFRPSPANRLGLWLGRTVDVAFHGGVCVRPAQGKRGGRWYDVAPRLEQSGFRLIASRPP